MLDRIQSEIVDRDWATYRLTGASENREQIVNAFQNHDGPCVFLISLKAGGVGLNLMAADYVILYDPWWNPAVENQAIDRAHRIGRQSKVIAYRMIMKGSIEEKIRLLQNTKAALVDDVLNDEAFSRSLTVDDFHFLLGDG